MYATVRTLKIQESFKEENRRRVFDELLEQFRTIPGFIDYYLVYTSKDIEVSIGFCKDKKGVDAMNKMANDFVKGVAPKVELASIYEGEVAVQARTPAIA